MGAILGIFSGTAATPVDAPIVDRMLAGMERRGHDQAAAWQDAGAALGVSRHDWELNAGFSGPVLVVQDDELCIAADASLYYRNDLRRKLAACGVRPSGQTPSHLILAAYRAWGERCAEHLEGDFAFVLYDRRHRRVVAARDFGGRRPLHHAVLADGTLLVASTISGILAHPRCPQEFDWEEIAVDAASLHFSVGAATCYRAVRRVLGGQTLVAEGARPPRFRDHWTPRAAPDSPERMEDAADQLRHLLTEAVEERLDVHGKTAIWLSGGWDSPSVYAVAQQLAASGRAIAPASLRAVSFRLPREDVRCETPRIERILDRWNGSTRWVDTGSVPAVRDAWAEAEGRDEPWAHPFEQLVREVVSTSRATGAHVSLDGFGGDTLFQNSRVVLAELLATGQWGAFARQWRALPNRDRSVLFQYIMRPLVPPSLTNAIGMLRGGRPPSAPHQRAVPFWFAKGAFGPALLARSAAGAPMHHGRRPALGEMLWQLRCARFQRVAGAQHGFALDAGMETRAPMWDARVIEFALSRPWSERYDAGEGKLLLRRAMANLLPDDILASRPPGPKSGSLGGYHERWLPLLAQTFATPRRSSPLADAGVVDGAALRRTAALFASDPTRYPLPMELVATLRTDLWLEARAGVSRPHARTTNTGLGDVPLAIAAAS